MEVFILEKICTISAVLLLTDTYETYQEISEVSLSPSQYCRPMDSPLRFHAAKAGEKKRIIRSNERKVFLILDNLRIHHHKALNDFLVEHAAFIKLFHLSGYNPNLNPDEYLNRDFKANLNNKPLGRAKGKIEAHAKNHMESIAQDSRHVINRFHAETVNMQVN